MKKQNKNKLIPVIAQDCETGEVLMLAYANQAALKKSLKTKKAWYFSRERKQLWQKGETSGNFQILRGVFEDCDKDALLYLVEQKGKGACHLGTRTCFEKKIFGKKPFTLFDLEKTIKQRKKEKPSGSYTVKLLENKNLIYEKLKEECAEVIKAAKKEGRQRTIEESADLLYFLEVLLGKEGISLAEVSRELGKRSR